MKKYELDGRLCLDKEDLCLRLIALLHFPDYCGHNLDALYDCLTTLPEAAELTVTHFDSLEKRLGSWGRRLRKMLLDAADGQRLLVSLPEAEEPTAAEVNALGSTLEQELLLLGGGGPPSGHVPGLRPGAAQQEGLYHAEGRPLVRLAPGGL